MLPKTGRSQRFKEALERELQLRRLRVGLSQSALAQELGIDQATVSRTEAGDRSLTLEESFRWFEALGMSINESCELVEKIWRHNGSRNSSLWPHGKGD